MSVESIITENLDVWTSAIKTKSISGRESSKKLELYGIKKLRELIIELAVRGKLLPQDSTDEPARVVLENIEAERALLGQNKRVKNFKPINKEFTQPHAIPMNWEFVQLEQIALFTGGFAFKSAQYVEEGTRVIRISDFDERGLKMENIVRYQYEPKLESFLLAKDDLLMAMTGGTVGKSLLLEKLPEPLLVNQRVAGIRLFSGIEPKYIKYVLQTKLIQNVISEAKNSTNDNISMGDIRGFLIPLPPMKHQRLLVLKIDELMTLCDQLESQTEASIEAHQTLVKSLLETLTNAKDADELNESWKRISEHFDVLFSTEDSIDQLKQTILQLAVMGKLVKQDPNDEPASKLLERIAAEKEQLIKDKKIKKQKPLAPITEAERWFSSPDSWSWIRLGELGYILGGGTPSKAKKEFWGGDVPWVSPKDMKLDFIESALDSVTDEAINNTSASIIPVGSLLMVVRGMILAHSFPVAISKKALIINQDMKALVFSQVLPEYLLLIMKAFKGMIVDLVDRSSHGTCKLVSEKLFNIALPIPPKNEQERILEKLSKLEKLQDALASKIAARCLIERNICDAIAIDNQCRTSLPPSDNSKYKLSEDELLKSVWDSLGSKSKYVGYIRPKNIPLDNYLGMVKKSAGLTVLGRDGDKGVRYTKFSQLVTSLKSIIFVEDKLGLSGIPLLGSLLTSILNSFGFEVKLDQKAAIVLLCFPPSLKRTAQELLDGVVEKCKQYKLQTIDEQELGGILNHFYDDGLMTKHSNGVWVLKEKFKHEIEHW
ncbi:restriction endonuclease subunit S [Alteromonas lipolytica]|uniref:Type I restriction modification DNA specificity domain-containing protein n=1 Tax=Alteromonas lipolytica TaxID=1856405 RepID=A0A1E8FH65_9ALTE|nr:restriction endonuclease subunit S [Alteromonas lipolytica]OFI34803.1 hypothetical protein BFC17_14600 [Alteromonas lipolytica]GGF54130.1 hypothetical protein GCM10011338_02870 [Alteromonas lipolytica]